MTLQEIIALGVVNSTALNKKRAWRVTNIAVHSGKLCRPQVCQCCGATHIAAPSVRPIITAHHTDYRRPLDVLWLCWPCHSQVHKALLALSKRVEQEAHLDVALWDAALDALVNRVDKPSR